MKIFIYVLSGVVGGVLGGMGMGGGTLLIPLLTLAAGAEQHLAQGVNLAAFIPTSAVALAFHLRKKLVDGKSVLLAVVPSTAASVLASLFSKRVAAEHLKRCFGIFLLTLGIYLLVSAVFRAVKKNSTRRKTKNDPLDPLPLSETAIGLFAPRPTDRPR